MTNFDEPTIILPEEEEEASAERPSDPVEEVRRRVRQAASVDYTVLILGEPGAGKELVARAIAQQSRRAKGPFVTVNMATVAPTTAAADLFGYEQGAFPGAKEPRPGLFRQAEGGVLFLNMIDAAPIDVQLMLRRAVDTREIRPLGCAAPRLVDVRILAATTGAVLEPGRFDAGLLHRLSSITIDLPPLHDLARATGPGHIR